MNANQRVELGDEVRDTVSGFRGIAIGKTDWLNGCTRIVIQPQIDKDKKFVNCETFDEPQLEILQRQKVKGPELIKKARASTGKTGGPDRATINRGQQTRR